MICFSPDGSATLLNKKTYFCYYKRATVGATFMVYKNCFFAKKWRGQLDWLLEKIILWHS